MRPPSSPGRSMTHAHPPPMGLHSTPQSPVASGISRLARVLSSKSQNPDAASTITSNKKEANLSLSNGETELNVKIDIALVGVEFSGKSTFFKQVCSFYTPEDFKQLVLYDARSQAIGTILRQTISVLNICKDNLVSADSKKASKSILRSITLYTLNKTTAHAVKVLWKDEVFLETFKESPFYQSEVEFESVLGLIMQCEKLMEDGFAVNKNIHLKLHTQTHGYNSTKFNFFSSHQSDSNHAHGSLVMGKSLNSHTRQSRFINKKDKDFHYLTQEPIADDHDDHLIVLGDKEKDKDFFAGLPATGSVSVSLPEQLVAGTLRSTAISKTKSQGNHSRSQGSATDDSNSRNSMAFNFGMSIRKSHKPTKTTKKARQSSIVSNNGLVGLSLRKQSITMMGPVRTKLRKMSLNNVLGLNFSRPTSLQRITKRKNEVNLWDIGGLFERRKDWEYFLRRSNVPLFFCSLGDYSSVTEDGSSENLLQDSLDMFKVLCESEFLKTMKIHVILTKIDVFEEKLCKLRIPLNKSGLFDDAPSGADEFDLEMNIEYIQERFFKVTETENSFLTRDNVTFKVINLLDDISVHKFFLELVNSVKRDADSDASKEKLIVTKEKVNVEDKPEKNIDSSGSGEDAFRDRERGQTMSHFEKLNKELKSQEKTKKVNIRKSQRKFVLPTSMRVRKSQPPTNENKSDAGSENTNGSRGAGSVLGMFHKRTSQRRPKKSSGNAVDGKSERSIVIEEIP